MQREAAMMKVAGRVIAPGIYHFVVIVRRENDAQSAV